LKYIIILLGLLLNVNLISQDLVAEFKSNYNIPKLSFKLGTSNVSGVNRVDNNWSFAFAMSGKIYDKIYLKTTISRNTYNSYQILSWGNASSGVTTYGNFELVTDNFEISPELRFYKNNLFFINAGLGIAHISNGKFIDGNTRIFLTNYSEPEYYHRFNGSLVYYRMNAGFNYKFKTIGVLGEIGLSDFKRSKSSKSQLGFNRVNEIEFELSQLVVKLGITYNLSFSNNDPLN